MAVAPAVEQERRPPDPNALEVAAKLQEQLPHVQVILFGSRGRRGTWHQHSDLDLAVIGLDRKDRNAVNGADTLAHGITEGVYRSDSPLPHVQVFPFTRTEYEALRESLPHIAGQVQFWGLTPEGVPLPPMPQNNPWPGVRPRLHASRRHCEKALRGLGQGDRFDAVEHTHKAVETMLKAALGAKGIQFEKIHELHELSGLLRTSCPEWSHVCSLLSPSQQMSMSKFRAVCDYEGYDSIPWPEDPPQVLVADMQEFCGQVASLILDEMGKEPGEVGYPHTHGVVETAFAGWDLATPDEFSTASEIEAGEARGRAEGAAQGEAAGEKRGINIGIDIGRAQGVVQGVIAERTSAAKKLIPVLLNTVLDDSDRQTLESYWDEHGAPSDYLEKLQEVQRNSDLWMEICDIPHETDGYDTSEPGSEGPRKPPQL